MSNKNKLSYEAQEPAFLRRLREGQGPLDGRSNVQIARPQKSRLKTSADDDEDEPVIVDESGQVVGKQEWEGRLKAENSAESQQPAAKVTVQTLGDDHVESSKGQEQKVAGIGGHKKRKAVKVLSGEDVDEPSGPVKSIPEATASFQSTVKGSKDVAKRDAEARKDEDASIAAAAAPKKKKAKKIKLSFDEPE